MKVALLQTGKTTDKYIAEGVCIYSERIKKYSPFEILTVPDIRNTRNMPASEQKSKEGEKILQHLKEDDYIVILDERGKEFTTIEFSSFLGKTLMLPKKRIVFVIGGPWGVSESVLGKADLRLSLSKLTFSHQLVRLLFMEQLYRVFTVLRGDPYHHE